MNLSCSIVIPTINRQDVVRDLVAVLQKQSYRPIQIVIVDQTKHPDSAMQGMSDITYRHIETPGTPNARNIGVSISTGEIIVFFDDDIELPDIHCIAKMIRFFEQQPTYMGVACKIIDKNEKLNRENQSEDTRVMHITWSGKVLPFARGNQEQDVTAPRGGGMAFRRKAIVSAGGFDTRFVGNAMREETDFSLRVIKSSGPIRYLPSCEIIHLALPRGGSRSQDRMRWYRDFFANEFLFQCTHFSPLALFPFFVRKLRPILACMFWYGIGRPRALLTPFFGFYDGFRRYRKGFTPQRFS